jgi:hypothetical protein
MTDNVIGGTIKGSATDHRSTGALRSRPRTLGGQLVDEQQPRRL